MIPLIVSILLAGLTFVSFDYVKNLPFHYITQTKYAICNEMNNDFCSRIANFFAMIIVYFIALTCFNAINIKLNQDPIANVFSASTVDFNLKMLAFGSVVAVIVAVSVFSTNLALGFSKFKSFNQVSVQKLFVAFVGMFMNSVSEELLYRGVLVGFIAPFLQHPMLSVVASSLVFGYVHFQYSLFYGVSAIVSGVLLGLGFLQFGIWWCIGFHWLFNFVETGLNTICKTVSKNKLFAGERKTPDDDGITTPIIELGLIGLYFSLYFDGWAELNKDGWSVLM